jgi:hypothetical protein
LRIGRPRSPGSTGNDRGSATAGGSPPGHSRRASLRRRPLATLLAIDDVAGHWGQQLAGGPNLGPRKEAFRQRGFEYKEDISQTSEGKWRDEYSYTYEGKKTLFAPHITIGAKQADKCLSVHMFWDEPKSVVVIAHVGRHKTNTRT